LGHIAPGNPLNKFTGECAHLSVLLPRSLGDFQCNLFRDITRPTLVGIESHNAENALVFTPEDALDNGLLVCPEFVDFPPGAAELTEVLKDSVHCQIMSWN